MNATCRSCGAPIIWALTETDQRAMPLDAEPTDGGNVVVVGLAVTARGAQPVARILGGAHPDLFGGLTRPGDTGGPYYRAHFASCPDAAGWRHRDAVPAPSREDHR